MGTLKIYIFILALALSEALLANPYCQSFYTQKTSAPERLPARPTGKKMLVADVYSFTLISGLKGKHHSESTRILIKDGTIYLPELKDHRNSSIILESIESFDDRYVFTGRAGHLDGDLLVKVHLPKNETRYFGIVYLSGYHFQSEFKMILPKLEILELNSYSPQRWFRSVVRKLGQYG